MCRKKEKKLFRLGIRKEEKMRTGDSRQSIMQNSIKWTNMCRVAVFEVERERKALKKKG